MGIHSYPFGLTMAGISSKALGFGGSENKIKYNGYEQQNKEFSDGSGLEWYDYKNRFYDNQIGRFFCVDRLASEYPYYTPYQFAGNEVPNATDLDGLEPDRDPTRPEYNRTASLSYTNASQASSTSLRNVTESRAISQSPTVGPSSKTYWVTEQSNALKAESEYYKNIQGATMDPVAGQAGMGLALTMKAAAELPFDVAEHSNNIVQGVKQGDGWKIAGNAALLALDVGAIGLGKTAVKGVSPNVQKVLNMLDAIKAEGGKVVSRELKVGQEVNMSVTKGTERLNLRIETHTVPTKYGGNGITPQKHLNIDLLPNKNILPNGGHKILE